MCEHLVVAVCQDDYVTEVKHKVPVYSEGDRMRILAALKCVDEVVPVSIEETEDKLLLLKNHPFDVLFSGDDWKGTERYKKTEEQFSHLDSCIEYFPYMRREFRRRSLSGNCRGRCGIVFTALASALRTA